VETQTRVKTGRSLAGRIAQLDIGAGAQLAGPFRIGIFGLLLAQGGAGHVALLAWLQTLVAALQQLDQVDSGSATDPGRSASIACSNSGTN
jgi:hypothetical protein